MKARMIIVAAALALALSGCMTFGQTGVLVTPFGVAGLHNFKPRDKTQSVTPDTITVAKVARAEAGSE